METAQIMRQILHERRYQEERWGNDFDDTHTQNDWVAFITAYAGQAMCKNPDDADKQYPTADIFFTAMVKVATLAVAALEAAGRYQDKSRHG